MVCHCVLVSFESTPTFQFSKRLLQRAVFESGKAIWCVSSVCVLFSEIQCWLNGRSVCLICIVPIGLLGSGGGCEGSAHGSPSVGDNANNTDVAVSTNTGTNIDTAGGHRTTASTASTRDHALTTADSSNRASHGSKHKHKAKDGILSFVLETRQR